SAGDLWSTVKTASWEWALLTFALAPAPQFVQAMVMKGSVPIDLPTGPVVAVQFANNFTGLVAGTTGNFILNVRFFQQQGQPVATAVSSGAMIGLSGFMSQLFVVAVGIVMVGANLTSRTSDGESSSDSLARLGWLLLAVAVIALAVAIARRMPRARRFYEEQIKSQLSAGIANLKKVLRTPKKALQLF